MCGLCGCARGICDQHYYTRTHYVIIRRLPWNAQNCRWLSSSRKETTPSRPRKSRPKNTYLDCTTTSNLNRSLPLAFGGELPYLTMNWQSLGDEDKPVVYIMPSMSHSAHVARADKDSVDLPGWWEQAVGWGPEYGVDLNRFRVISASPLVHFPSPVHTFRTGRHHHRAHLKVNRDITPSTAGSTVQLDLSSQHGPTHGPKIWKCFPADHTNRPGTRARHVARLPRHRTRACSRRSFHGRNAGSRVCLFVS